MTHKDCGWGKVDYTPYFYAGKTIIKREKEEMKTTSMKATKILFVTNETNVTFETISPEKLTDAFRGSRYNAILLDSGVMLAGEKRPMVEFCVDKSGITMV